ncbi:cell envelope integrity protein TolA [Rhodoferax saidenbachensis]|uniref:Colicin import membrane protein n=1 Tax=Rhodoferax saidenbachensis TaxID=1484693 RepID=A0ABU1ZJ55_9BURK|nr:cell envelope integrity protein TolA [Rhodoferax saidenbachensis]MDR7304915.1 colicin import membrane protein [Rhodoferax saidenbachensis]
MQPSRQHLEFAPPHTPGMLRAFALAILAHLVLVFILAVGVAWKRETPPATVEAELWANIPVEAAPPPPEPQPEPDPEPAPPLPVPPTPRPAPPPDAPSQADIALAKEKARVQKEKEQQKLELDRKLQEKQQKEKLEKDKLEKDKLQKAKDAKEKEAKEKLARDKAEKDKADKAKTADTAKQKAEKAAQAKAEAQKLEDLRQQNLKRMAGLAGSGDANAAGSAAKSAGPSASYSGRIRAKIKPNITYIETIVGNPTAEVEVRASPDGTILSRRIAKGSGNKSWDDAALNAIDKTGVLPRDEDGRVPSPMIIIMSPQTMIGN